jgi:hypothetical protein
MRTGDENLRCDIFLSWTGCLPLAPFVGNKVTYIWNTAVVYCIRQEMSYIFSGKVASAMYL